MSEHKVYVEFPTAEILNRDATFEIVADDARFGRLTVSRGGVGWFPHNAPVERHLTWEQFDQVIRRHFNG